MSDLIEDDDVEDHDEEHEDDDEHHLEGMAANTFEQWKKVGLRKLIDWGPGYKLFYKSKAYDIDMDFFGSLPLGRGIALRRKYYIKNSDGKIVAKMKEVGIWKKLPPLFDNNWQIDVYDKELARDGSFGYILTLITQYLRNDRLYAKNACQKALRKQKERVLKEEAV